jgi:hypothetical protein
MLFRTSHAAVTDEYEVMVEWYIDRKKPKNSGKNLPLSHFVHHKFHKGAKPGKRPATNRLNHSTTICLNIRAKIRNFIKTVLNAFISYVYCKC